MRIAAGSDHVSRISCMQNMARKIPKRAADSLSPEVGILPSIRAIRNDVAESEPKFLGDLNRDSQPIRDAQRH